MAQQMEEVTIRVRINGLTEITYLLPAPAMNAALALAKAQYGNDKVLGIIRSRLVAGWPKITFLL